MKFFNSTLDIETKKELEFIDITEKIQSIIEEAEITNGFCNIQSLHTTAVLAVNENEPLLISDFQKYLKQIFPKGTQYQHDNLSVRTVNMCDDECKNGHSHCKAILLPTTVTLNLIDGALQLGKWQRIFFIELDRARKRQAQIHIMGE